MENLSRARQQAVSRKSTGYGLAGFGALFIALSFVIGGPLFGFVGVGLLLAGIIVTGTARHRIQDIDAQSGP